MLRHRYLFEQMVRRELRQKYKGSALGVLWYVVNPLVPMGRADPRGGRVGQSSVVNFRTLRISEPVGVWVT